MPDMDDPVNIDLEPEDAFRVLLATPPLGSEAETVEPADEDAEE
ncbi:MAG: hypothetical protein ABSD78_12200 [Acidimicrobiales bacterium]|jgi:hypothetical protein